VKKLIFLTLIFLIGCQESKSPKVTEARTQSEVNAAVVSVLAQYAPHILAMPKGEGQAVAVMDLFHNATQIKNDPRQGTLAPEKLAEATLNDPEMGLICGGFALVIFDTLQALGYETRMVQMFTNGRDNHIANEAMVDGHWIALDGTYNVVFKNSNGDLLSYREMKEQVNNGDGLGAEYAGNTHHRLEDNYLPYEPYLANVRALPIGLRSQPYLVEVFQGEERF